MRARPGLKILMVLQASLKITKPPSVLQNKIESALLLMKTQNPQLINSNNHHISVAKLNLLPYLKISFLPKLAIPLVRFFL